MQKASHDTESRDLDSIDGFGPNRWIWTAQPQNLHVVTSHQSRVQAEETGSSGLVAGGHFGSAFLICSHGRASRPQLIFLLPCAPDLFPLPLLRIPLPWPADLSCTFLRCVNRLPRCEKSRSHWLHLKGFCPVCVRMWPTNVPFCTNFLLHIVH